MSYFKSLPYVLIFYTLTLSPVALSSVENYFYNANLNNSKARQKEIYFNLLVESPGLFSSSSQELHMKATMVVSATDKVRFLIEQYSDSSYNDEKFEGIFISDDLNVTDSKDKLLLGVLSYVFFGRSL